MIYLLSSFSIIMLKLSPYMAVGLILAAAVLILIRHLRQISAGQGSCCTHSNADNPEDARKNQSCSGCSGCPKYASSGKTANLKASNDKLNSTIGKAGSVKS